MLDPCAREEQVTSAGVKGPAVVVFSNQALAALSDGAADCREQNAVSVAVEVSGTSPSATVSLEGSPERGGNYLPLSDPASSQTGVTTSRIFDAIVGAAWVKVRLADVSGAFTVTVTPYISPGPSSLTAVVT